MNSPAFLTSRSSAAHGATARVAAAHAALAYAPAGQGMAGRFPMLAGYDPASGLGLAPAYPVGYAAQRQAMMTPNAMGAGMAPFGAAAPPYGAPFGATWPYGAPYVPWLQPAGQAAPLGAVDAVNGRPCLSGETQAQCNARARVAAEITRDASASLTEAQRAAQQQALFNTISAGLTTAGTTIASIVSSGNAIEIARIQANAQQQLAQIQADLARARAAGDAVASQQAAAQQAALFQVMAQLQGQQAAANPNMPYYILGGVLVLALAAGGVYLATRGGGSQAAPARR